jgi:ribonucleotide monophosphatase NagD (HAD superfamily)
VGKFAVTGFYLNPGNDSINWGQNVLPVATLDSLQYVFIGNLSKASGYVMRARFDSLGSAAYLIFHIVTSPDTISAYAALGPSGAYSIGYEWGLRIWAGEQRVGQ